MGATKENQSKATKKKTGSSRKVGKNATTGRFVSPRKAGRADIVIRSRSMGGVRSQPFTRGEIIRKKVGFNQQEFAGFLGIDPRTYSRRADEDQLKSGESLQVEMLDEALNEAIRVFRDEELARKWLHSPIISLDNRRPIDHLNSIEGYERVKDTLGKIEYGMY